MSPARASALRGAGAAAPSVARALAALLLCSRGSSALTLPPEVPERVADQVRAVLADPEGRVEVLSADHTLPAESYEVVCAEDGHTVVRSGSLLASLYGLYALAQSAGYAFLHPLYVVRPTGVPDWCHTLSACGRGVSTPAGVEAVRGTHLHTQHPIELADLLNGVGPSPGGRGPSEDEAAWASGLPMWTQYLQWLVANKQNLVEWALLEWGPTDGFSTSPVRKRRLTELVVRAQEWGLSVSIDAPVNLQQQHAFRLQVGEAGEGPLGPVKARLDWLCDLGLDMISTEIGSTEFSHANASETVALLNATVEYLAAKGKQLVVKNHASTNQYATGYKDPLEPSKELNFNYITYYADKRVVSAPHTVQMYSLSDPLVGSYGRRNFSDIFAMMKLLDREGKPQVFFPETAYWVDFDNSVPLFLPLYATDRLRDLQTLSREVPRAGHLNFESGWAFGYWINNAAQAFAAWSRRNGEELIEERLFHSLLAPLGAPFDKVADVLFQLAALQNRTLVHDVFEGPEGYTPQTMMGYLQGWEGMAEAQEHFQVAVVMPPRVHPRDISKRGDWYIEALAPRLKALASAARPLARRCRALRAAHRGGDGGDAARAALLKDACVGVELFSLRVEQVGGIYEAASGAAGSPEGGLLRSAAAIREGLALIESLALAPEWTRWTGEAWPTAYPYGYLWPAASLFFWRRDHQIVAHGVSEACYLNLYDPVEIGLPFSRYKRFFQNLAHGLSKTLGWLPWFYHYAGCLTGPSAEPPAPLDAAGALATTAPPMAFVERAYF
mmetsp:Transcript_86070/g.242342  ORF Transcript_86070/g.242342 Transcript_86070/m.242342 type:complete len:783 (-) Transcript_86070:2-2350(-)